MSWEREEPLASDSVGPGRSASLVLIAGFALAIIALLLSGYLGIQAMEGSEERAARLLQEQQISNRLIDEIQGEEASLSGLFYQLAGLKSDRAALVLSLDTIEQAVGRTLQTALATPKDGRWSAVKVAVEAYIEEMRRALAQPGDNMRTTEALFDKHELLVSAMANLVAANYEETLLAQQDEMNRSRSLLGRSLIILGFALVLALGSAAGTVYLSNQMFHRIRWQAQELSRLSGHVLERQETVIRRFSRELHDELGQTLTAIEATLVAFPQPTREQKDQLEDCQLLVKDAILKTREMSQLLRPSVLDDFGLCPSLQSLVDSFKQRRTGISVRTRLEFDERLPGATETHLFRIAQEALTNAARHSGASAIELSLTRVGRSLVLEVNDNGHGLGPRGSGFGLIGMRERARAISARLDINSTPQGVTIRVEAPIEPAG